MRIVSIFCAIVVLLAFTVTPAQAQVCCSPINAEVSLDKLPTPVRLPGKASKVWGPFEVTNLRDSSYLVGNGKAEKYSWRFDLRGSNPNYDDFLSCASTLTSATLTLTLVPGGCLKNRSSPVCGNDIWSDTVKIGGLPQENFLIEFRSIRGNVVGTRSLNLLDKFTPLQILNEVRSSGGFLSVEYQDDAVVQFAEINLVAAP